MKYHAVLFDLDGTLLDTAPDFVTATNLLRQSRGLAPLPVQAIRAWVTNGSTGLVSKAFELHPEHHEVEPLRQELLRFYLENIVAETRPFPGIAALLEALGQAGIPWGIVTNKPVLYTNAILQGLPLDPAPEAVVCPDHVNKMKPDPESVLLACSELAVKPQEAIYIGDHQRDIEAGRGAGTTTVAAAYGYLEEDTNPATWGADYLVHHADELAGIIF